MNKNIYIALSFVLVAIYGCNDKSKSTKKSNVSEQEQTISKKNTNDVTSQIDSLTNLIEADAQNAKLYMERAELWLSSMRHIPADHDLKMAVKLDSTNENYLLAYGNHSALMNNTRQSKMLWENCSQLNKKNTSCRIKLSELHFFVQEYKTSIKYANEVLGIDKANYLAYFFKGMSLLETGDTLHAVRSFQNSIEYKPDFVRSMEMLASVFAAKNDLLAIDYYKAILNVNPNHSNVHFNMAVFYQNRRQFKKSINYYELALKNDPQNGGILYNTGYIFQELKLYKESIEYFSKAIEIDKVDFKSYFARGYVYELLGNIEAAKADYQTILLIKPGYGPATAQLAGLKK